MIDSLAATAADHMRRLCVDLPTRRVGSAGNRAATAYFASVAASHGFAIEQPEFECLDWQADGAALAAGDDSFEVLPGPYSPGCDVSGPLRVVEAVEQLQGTDLSDAIVLLRGAIAREQLMPKNFPFYNPDEHRRIIAALESARPRAIVTATGHDPAMAGALYPFPLIEDGDFDIPSAYMTDEEGARLAALDGQTVSLTIRAQRIPSTGCNTVARRGPAGGQRIVFFAHIDAKAGTPGAIDNASGVTVLSLLAGLLTGYQGGVEIELVALNGEDYYSAPGEQLYLARNADRFGSVALGINLDGLGYRRGRIAYSLYECPPDLAATARDVFGAREEFVEGEAWYQGDHMLFVLNGRPALALTSELAAELMTEIIHTPRDTVEVVDPARLAQAALALRDLLVRLDATLAPGRA